jgi:hypothetical protein
MRRAIVDHPDVHAIIWAADALFDLMNRGPRAYERGEVMLNDAEARELLTIRQLGGAAHLRIREGAISSHQPYAPKTEHEDPSEIARRH